jgi:hypothetical protein
MTRKDKIKEIQKWAGTTPDGILGDKTIDAIWKKIQPTESTVPDEQPNDSPVSAAYVSPAELVRKGMAKKILNMEDYKITGPESLRVTRLPSGDGGGTWEIAGICDGIEPKEFNLIKSMLDRGDRDAAWEECLRYVLANTEPLVAKGVAGSYAIEFMLRDMTFNMGVAGTTKVVQRMLDIGIDGKWGKNTQAKWTDVILSREEMAVLDLLDRACRARYRSIVKANPVKEKFLTGWMNRCDARHAYALTLLSRK